MKAPHRSASRARRALAPLLSITAAATALSASPDAIAQATSTPTSMGAPPPEAKAEVSAPKGTPDAPKVEKPLDGTNASLSAGGLLTTGNSRLFAASANGVFEKRFDDNGVSASLLANYGQGGPAGQPIQVTTQNVQGRVRYDRYLSDRFAVLVINTGRHDRFQGLDFRYNLDPGAKYLFIPEASRALWAELGYDFQYDIRRNSARTVLDADKNPVIDPATGQPQLLDKTFADHSIRAYVGHKHAFNKEVTLALGVEYLQSFIDSTRYRVNGDALFAAKVGGGLAVGLGVSMRFDHHPLPGKEKLDTATTMSLIYAFSDIPEPKKETCPCPEPPPPPPSGVSPMPSPPPPAPPSSSSSSSSSSSTEQH